MVSDGPLERCRPLVVHQDLLIRDCPATKGPTLLGVTGPFLQLVSVDAAAPFPAPEPLRACRSDLSAWQDTNTGVRLLLGRMRTM